MNVLASDNFLLLLSGIKWTTNFINLCYSLVVCYYQASILQEINENKYILVEIN